MTWEEFLNSSYDKTSPVSENFNLIIKSFDDYTDVVVVFDTDYVPYIIRDSSGNFQYKTGVIINNTSYEYYGER